MRSVQHGAVTASAGRKIHRRCSKRSERRSRWWGQLRRHHAEFTNACSDPGRPHAFATCGRSRVLRYQTRHADMLPYVKSPVTSTQVRSYFHQSQTLGALYQGYQLGANMASHSKQHLKSEKFGHLPLSTSGPQKTTLTVSNTCSKAHPFPLIPAHREMHSLEPHTSTKALPSQQRNVQHSNCTDSSQITSKPLTSRFDEPMNSTSPAPATLRRTRS